MFNELPTQIQEQIKILLAANDFRAAKALYDLVSKKSAQDK